MGVRKADTFSGTLLASHGCPGSSAPLVPNALLSKLMGPGFSVALARQGVVALVPTLSGHPFAPQQGEHGQNSPNDVL